MAEVYTDVVVQSMCERQDLFVLRSVGHDDFQQSDGFPSWVPRWDRSDPWSFHWLDKSTLSASKYRAELPDIDLARAGILKLKGVIFDRIAWVSDVLGQGSRSFMSDAKVRTAFIKLWLEATGEQPNSSFAHQVTIEELATTTTGGIIKASAVLHDKDTSEAWLDMGEIDTEAGRDFIASFKTFMDTDTYPGSAQCFDVLLACSDRRIFRTQKGYLGLGRSGMQVGDAVTVLHGSRVPFVLRSIGEPGKAYFTLVGDCFVHAIMRGEAYDMLEEESVTTGIFEIQ